jgi:hypothetical protein
MEALKTPSPQAVLPSFESNGLYVLVSIGLVAMIFE